MAYTEKPTTAAPADPPTRFDNAGQVGVVGGAGGADGAGGGCGVGGGGVVGGVVGCCQHRLELLTTDLAPGVCPYRLDSFAGTVVAGVDPLKGWEDPLSAVGGVVLWGVAAWALARWAYSDELDGGAW